MSKRQQRCWAVIAGGGTAGHVNPGLAIAAELIARGAEPRRLHWVGSRRGIEARLVHEAGLGLTLLPGRGIQRKLTPANAKAAAGLAGAFVAALALMRRLRPAVVIGLGGYASVPCVGAARVLRVPVVLLEENAVAGLANRMAGRFAAASAVSFADTALPRSTWTGNPVRPEVIEKLSRAAGRDEVAPGGRKRLAVVGGSLGSRRINEALFAALPAWRDRGDLSVHHICGARDHPDLAQRIPISADDSLEFCLVEYEDDMAAVYAAADLVLCRAGAATSAELAIAGVPSILVPLPGAPDDHQSANARAMADAGAALVVPDEDLDARRLIAEIDSLLDDPARLRSMSEAATSLARPDAAAAVADLVSRHARRPIAEAGLAEDQVSDTPLGQAPAAEDHEQR